jgi:hypothetical protein
MLTNMIFLSPAAMAPAVSASNDAAAAILAGAADAPKTFSAATAQAATATTAATTAAAMAVVRACAAAASACGAALTALWERCQLALQRLFGGAATQETAPCKCTCKCVSDTTAPTAPTVPTETETDTADEADIPTPTPTPSTTATPKHIADSSEQLVVTATDSVVAPTDIENVTGDAAPVRSLINEPQQEPEQEPAQKLVVPRAVAEHVVSVHDPLTTAVMEQLIARHEALGHVPRDTVSQLISCLHAHHHDRESVVLGTADPLVMVDVVLRALEHHEFHVAAAYAVLSRRWMRCYRIVWLEHTRRELQRQYVEVEQGIKKVSRSLALLDATGQFGVATQ